MNHKGEIVYALSGKEAFGAFVVIKEDAGCGYICNGKRRKVDNLKKKNLKHLKFTGIIAENVATKLQNGEQVTNTDVKNALKNFLSNNSKCNFNKEE